MFNLSSPIFGLLFVVDLLLLPMFHIQTLPFKYSFILLGLMCLVKILNKNRGQRSSQLRQDWKGFAIAIFIIIFASICGEIWLRSVQNTIPSSHLIRSLLIYILVILSFGFGQISQKFKLDWLIYILIVAFLGNVGMIYYGIHIPGLYNLYYGDYAIESLSKIGIYSRYDFFNFQRSRGLFGNPNVSMLQVNVIFLFIVLATQNKLLTLPNAITRITISTLTLILAIMLGSKSEFIVSSILAIVFSFQSVSDRNSFSRSRSTIVPLISVFIIPSTVILLGTEFTFLENGFNRVLMLGNIFDKSEYLVARNYYRPLIAWEWVSSRFAISPIIGSGYSSSAQFPFDLGTKYYHNDLFRLLITSGIVGTITFLLMLKKYVLPFGATSLLLFIIPGLTNTFILALPTMMFYFFMIGMFHSKIKYSEILSA